jgi:hypothetical protein
MGNIVTCSRASPRMYAIKNALAPREGIFSFFTSARLVFRNRLYERRLFV